MIRTLRWLYWLRMAARTATFALVASTATAGYAQPLSSETASRADASSYAAASMPIAGGAPFIAQILGDIGTYYLEPVSIGRVAMAGAAWLGGFDNRLAVREVGRGGAVALTYDNRALASYPAPAETDSSGWAATIETIIAAARRASPRIAALPVETVEQTVVNGMTRSLDRFSRYASPDLAQDQRAARNGWGGIGIMVDGAQDIFRVTAVEPHSPADRAGIRPEDQIVAIDGVTTHGCVHHEVIDRLRGPIGSAISVSVVPAGFGQTRELQLQRASVFEPTVSASRDGDVGVIRVHSFNHRTTTRVAESVAELHRAGRLTGIVLDLRSNPGGVLDEAVRLADMFLRRGPIVSVVGRHPASRQYFAASGKATVLDVPMVVLINGGSASASEIVAAALQDAGRAVVVGSSSYGKGTVQTVLRLSNNGELILTWARLMAPSGYLLNRHGVIPTICTADLPDDPAYLATGLTRAAAASRARVSLDEQGWAALRQSCPTTRNRPGLDLVLAKYLLSDSRWYEAALHALPTAAQSPVQTAAAPPRS